MKKVPIGLFCLPTSTRFHMQDLQRSSGATGNQYCYLLEATTTPEEGGYPFQIVLTSPYDLEMLLKWDIPGGVDNIVETQHAEVRKQLPQRRVVAIVYPDGETDGIMPAEGVGLPHWEFIRAREDGTPDPVEIKAAKMRVIERRNAIDSRGTRKAS